MVSRYIIYVQDISDSLYSQISAKPVHFQNTDQCTLKSNALSDQATPTLSLSHAHTQLKQYKNLCNNQYCGSVGAFSPLKHLSE